MRSLTRVNLHELLSPPQISHESKHYPHRLHLSPTNLPQISSSPSLSSHRLHLQQNLIVSIFHHLIFLLTWRIVIGDCRSWYADEGIADLGDDRRTPEDMEMQISMMVAAMLLDWFQIAAANLFLLLHFQTLGASQHHLYLFIHGRNFLLNRLSSTASAHIRRRRW